MPTTAAVEGKYMTKQDNKFEAYIEGIRTSRSGKNIPWRNDFNPTDQPTPDTFVACAVDRDTSIDPEYRCELHMYHVKTYGGRGFRAQIWTPGGGMSWGKIFLCSDPEAYEKAEISGREAMIFRIRLIEEEFQARQKPK